MHLGGELRDVFVRFFGGRGGLGCGWWLLWDRRHGRGTWVGWLGFGESLSFDGWFLGGHGYRGWRDLVGGHLIGCDLNRCDLGGDFFRGNDLFRLLVDRFVDRFGSGWLNRCNGLGWLRVDVSIGTLALCDGIPSARRWHGSNRVEHESASGNDAVAQNTYDGGVSLRPSDDAIDLAVDGYIDPRTRVPAIESAISLLGCDRQSGLAKHERCDSIGFDLDAGEAGISIEAGGDDFGRYCPDDLLPWRRRQCIETDDQGVQRLFVARGECRKVLKICNYPGPSRDMYSTQIWFDRHSALSLRSGTSVVSIGTEVTKPRKARLDLQTDLDQRVPEPNLITRAHLDWGAFIGFGCATLLGVDNPSPVVRTAIEKCRAFGGWTNLGV